MIPDLASLLSNPTAQTIHSHPIHRWHRQAAGIIRSSSYDHRNQTPLPRTRPQLNRCSLVPDLASLPSISIVQTTHTHPMHLSLALTKLLFTEIKQSSSYDQRTQTSTLRRTRHLHSRRPKIRDTNFRQLCRNPHHLDYLQPEIQLFDGAEQACPYRNIKNNRLHQLPRTLHILDHVHPTEQALVGAEKLYLQRGISKTPQQSKVLHKMMYSQRIIQIIGRAEDKDICNLPHHLIQDSPRLGISSTKDTALRWCG